MRGPLCQRCGDYSAGYVDGQSKALFEVSTQTTDHAVGRGCDPCLAVKPESTEGGGWVSVLKRQEGAPLNLG